MAVQKFKTAIDVQISLKLSALSTSRALQIGSGGLAEASAVTTTELGYLSGVTSSIQTQLGNKANDADVIKKDGSVAFTAAQSMGSFKLTNLADGTVSADAVNKGQLDLKVAKAGDTMSGNLAMGGNKVTGLGSPSAAGDAATKSYVDSVAEGLKPKTAARVATTANIVIATALNSGDSIDGVTLANGDRVLVKNQTDAEFNGIYIVGVTPARSSDFDSLSPIDEINGALVAVQEGTDNAGKIFVQSGAVATLDTDDINFVFFNSSSSLVGGDGITISGNNVSVDHDGNGLTFITNQLAIELDGSTLAKGASGLKLSDTAVTLGSYGSASQSVSITVDQQGRLTAASHQSISITASQVSDFNEAAQDAVGGALTDTSSIDFTYNDGANTISAVVLPAGVDHDSLQNFVSNEHVDHSSVSIATGANSGLTGGGDITTTRNLSVDINGTTAETSPDNADSILIYDNSATALKKMTRGNFLGASASSAGDISETSFAAANNQSSAANVTGFAFANGVVRSFRALVSIHLDATSDLFEVFQLEGIQKGSSWDMSISSTGDESGVVFSITNAGQIQYTSANSAGFVSNTIKFRALTTSV